MLMQCVGSVCCVQSLLSEGVEVDSSPLTFILQAASTVHLQLQVTPRQSGRLSFSGSHLVSSVMLLSYARQKTCTEYKRACY